MFPSMRCRARGRTISMICSKSSSLGNVIKYDWWPVLGINHIPIFVTIPKLL